MNCKELLDRNGLGRLDVIKRATAAAVAPSVPHVLTLRPECHEVRHKRLYSHGADYLLADIEVPLWREVRVLLAVSKANILQKVQRYGRILKVCLTHHEQEARVEELRHIQIPRQLHDMLALLLELDGVDQHFLYDAQHQICAHDEDCETVMLEQVHTLRPKVVLARLQLKHVVIGQAQIVAKALVVALSVTAHRRSLVQQGHAFELLLLVAQS